MGVVSLWCFPHADRVVHCRLDLISTDRVDSTNHWFHTFRYRVFHDYNGNLELRMLSLRGVISFLLTVVICGKVVDGYGHYSASSLAGVVMIRNVAGAGFPLCESASNATRSAAS